MASGSEFVEREEFYRSFSLFVGQTRFTPNKALSSRTALKGGLAGGTILLR
jgi:hypothetical protein